MKQSNYLIFLVFLSFVLSHYGNGRRNAAMTSAQATFTAQREISDILIVTNDVLLATDLAGALAAADDRLASAHVRSPQAAVERGSACRVAVVDCDACDPDSLGAFRDQIGRKVPLLLIADTTDIAQSLTVDAWQWFPKPVSTDVLAAHVAAVLNRADACADPVAGTG
jgi:DNA-binding response OmpR family regulator